MTNLTSGSDSPLRNEVLFEYFRLSLVTGILEKNDVIAWADNEILKRDLPQSEVIELSLSGRLPYSQLIGLLNQFQGAFRDALLVKLVLACAATQLASQPAQVVSLITGLRLLTAEDYLPPEIRRPVQDLKDALEAFRQGAITQDGLLEKARAFLAPYQEYAPLLRKVHGS